jgi:hypothetical protein
MSRLPPDEADPSRSLAVPKVDVRSSPYLTLHVLRVERQGKATLLANPLTTAKETLGCLTEDIPTCGLSQAGRKPLVQANLLLQMLPCSRGCRFSDECPESGGFAPVF